MNAFQLQHRTRTFLQFFLHWHPIRWRITFNHGCIHHRKSGALRSRRLKHSWIAATTFWITHDLETISIRLWLFRKSNTEKKSVLLKAHYVHHLFYSHNNQKNLAAARIRAHERPKKMNFIFNCFSVAQGFLC